MTNPDGIQLFCFPFAGAGPSFFRTWKSYKNDSINIKAIDLPGRERLIAEEPFTDLSDAVEYALRQILDQDLTKPFALFGHCFLGSIMAWETARRLVNAKKPPSHLFISASRAPSVRKYYGAKELTNKDFVHFVKNITGYTHPAYDIPEMLDLILPALRADFEMDESYSPEANSSVNLPVTIFHASNDKSVSLRDIEKWQESCVGDFKIITLAGGHMYLADDPGPLLNNILSMLTSKKG